MRKPSWMALTLLCLMLAGGALAQEHAHTFGAWTKMEGVSRHGAACNACGEVVEKQCATYSLTLQSGKKANVCALCGDCAYGAFSPVADAQATPLAEKTSKQRGEFAVYGRALPFAGEDDRILYAFTVAYNNDGAATAFKNKSRIQFRVDAQLPEQFTLLRVTSSAGDDSTQTPEKWTEIDHGFEDGLLTFESKNQAVYLIMA